MRLLTRVYDIIKSNKKIGMIGPRKAARQDGNDNSFTDSLPSIKVLWCCSYLVWLLFRIPSVIVPSFFIYMYAHMHACDLFLLFVEGGEKYARAI